MSATTIALLQMEWNDSRYQWESACPFCNPQSVDGAPVLEGDDRFFASEDIPGGTCRVCQANGRGTRGNGWYSDGQIAARMGKPLGADYVAPTIQPRIEKPLDYRDDIFVDAAHQNVDYQFWRERYNWTPDVVDKYKLGKGLLYPKHHNGRPQHIIPMRVERYGQPQFPAWYCASRGDAKERLAGSSKPFMAIREDDPTTKTFVHTEGDTDFVTAGYLGFENVGSIFGSHAWTDDKAQLVVERGYTKILVLTDPDEAGQTLAQHIVKSYHKRNINDVWILDWGDEREDLTGLLKTKNRDEARSWLLGRLILTQQGSQQNNYNTKERIKQPLISLEELRGNGEKSLRSVVNNWVNAYDLLTMGKGEVLDLQTPPGSGKTHVLIETAEKLARDALVSHQNQRKYLEEKIETLKQTAATSEDDMEELEKTKRQLANFSETAVAWYGQYKHGWEDVMAITKSPELWYNFEARNTDNCQNYTKVMELGEKHHDIGYFCRTSCPFFAQCKESGYLKQDEERKGKPITFFRHQHLMASMAQDYKQLVVIDEYAGSILENQPVRFKPEQIYAHRKGWQLETISFEMVEAITQFADATRAAMSYNAGAAQSFPDGSTNPAYIISGAQFLSLLDMQCRTLAGCSLDELVGRIDGAVLHQQYQPNFNGGKDDLIHLRCLPQFFDVVNRELLDYLDNPNNRYPSCIHCVAGVLEVYAPENIHTRHRTPLIVADATGMPILYEAMFKRKVTTYAPTIHNPNAVIEQVIGNDWTKGQLNTQMGAALKDRRKLQQRDQDRIISLEGEEFDPANVPVSAELYQSSMVQNALAIIKKLASKHESLLVVTHKDLREVLESHTQALFPQNSATAEFIDKIAWAHYGSVRGTNRYQDYEAVVLLGCFRIPYNIVWRRVQMWAWMLGIKEYIPPDTVRIMSTYDWPQAYQETEHRSFNHEFAQAYVDMIEQGELQQSAARIRPHSTFKEKFVYCFANRPAMQFINHITPMVDWMKTTELDAHHDLYLYMKKQYQKEGKFPSYRAVRTDYSVGTDTIKRLRLQIEKEVQTA